jgi:hypothetical protein
LYSGEGWENGRGRKSKADVSIREVDILNTAKHGRDNGYRLH